MLILEGFLVGLVVIVTNFLESWLSYPMLVRPMVVGPIVGILLGDLPAGVIMGANLELVFMGVVGIGGTTPPDANTGTAVGTAFAILMGADTEVALGLAVPIALLASMLNPLFMSIRTLINPYIDKLIEQGNYKGLERMVAVKSLISIVPKGIIIMIAVALGSSTVESFIAVIPSFVTGGLGVAGGMMAAVGFAMLLRMMWSKTMCIYFFLGFVAAAYLKLPIMAIAFFGIILCIILYYEGSFSKGTKLTTTKASDGEDLFND